MAHKNVSQFRRAFFQVSLRDRELCATNPGLDYASAGIVAVEAYSSSKWVCLLARTALSRKHLQLYKQ